MIEKLSYYELKYIRLWLNAITGKKATYEDLKKYIINNSIDNKYTLLNKLNDDFVKLPE